jgi:predicted transcriptional regulator
MKMQKTAKQINEQKWKRMKLILEKLKEKPLSMAEIKQLIYEKSITDKIVKRSLHNYIDELIALGLVSRNLEAGVYELLENKKVFQSRDDYEISLKHSKCLMISTREKQRLDQINPFMALDLLVFRYVGSSQGLDENNVLLDPQLGDDLDDKHLMQHIRTGYYDLFLLMQKYCQIMDEMGFSKIPRFPKLGSQFEFQDPSTMGIVSKAAMLRDISVREAHVENVIAKDEDMYLSDIKERNLERKPLYSSEERKRLRELYDIRDLLVGKLYFIINIVIHGTPLSGSCDCCPGRRITIKPKS